MLRLRAMWLAGVAVFAGLLLAAPAHAVPLLQLYIEGADYNESTQTWELDRPIDQPLRLWTIGNVDGPGGKGTIYDTKLSISYDSALGNSPSFVLTPSTTNGFGGFTDPSIASSPTFLGLHTDGSAPLLADGSSLAPHGVFGDHTYWQEYGLGDFSLEDSPIADFITAFPSAPATLSGQINVYEITVSGVPVGEWIHFDLYGAYMQGSHLKVTFAPFSHDADNQVQVSEPGTLALLGGALLVLAGFHWRGRLSPLSRLSLRS